MSSRAVYRRRRLVAALALVATTVAVILLARSCSDSPETSRPASAVPAECVADSASERRQRLGRRVVARMQVEATPALLRQARKGEIGGVVLFPGAEQDAGLLAAEIGKLQRAAERAGEPPLIVAIDQEGGPVKRLEELPPRRSPPELEGKPAAARAEGRAAAEALAALGINVDLAPVLDVSGAGSFLGERSFGADPASVSATGAAFVEGLDAGGVAATGKHFPGLGRSPVNTDEAVGVVDAGRAALLADLEPFERAIEAGMPLVMLSNAVYPALDPRWPAFASQAIADDLLRGELGFGGVTITDDLDAAAVRARLGGARAAVAALRGGSDLLLFALRAEPGVLDKLVRAERRGEIDEAAGMRSCARIIALRESFGR